MIELNPSAEIIVIIVIMASFKLNRSSGFEFLNLRIIHPGTIEVFRDGDILDGHFHELISFGAEANIAPLRHIGMRII